MTQPDPSAAGSGARRNVLAYSEINRRIQELDAHPTLCTLSIDGWLAWPVVKERVWLAGMTLAQDQSAAPPRPGLATAFSRIAMGLAELAVNLLLPRKCTAALLYEERAVRLPDGQVAHPHLGSLPKGPQADRLLHYLYVWGEQKASRIHRGRLHDYRLGAMSAALAVLLRHRHATRSLANEMAEVIGFGFPEFDCDVLYLSLADQLARFQIRRCFFAALFRRSKISRLIVLDYDGKIPEIAAAKSLGLPVIEVQHGMFSAAEPDYSWTTAHRRLAAPLPLPDRIVVFGPLWREELRRAGYWREDEIITARNPVLAPFRAYRAQSRAKKAPSGPLIVLFPSQPYRSEAALRFWHDVLALQRAKNGEGAEPLFVLRLKIHPLEQGRRSAYHRLANTFPETCVVVPEQIDAFEELIGADLVAGFTSLMMIEALGMEIPVITLRLSGEDESFWDTFRIRGFDETMRECSDAESFFCIVKSSGDDRSASQASSHAQTIHCLEGQTIESVLS